MHSSQSASWCNNHCFYVCKLYTIIPMKYSSVSYVLEYMPYNKTNFFKCLIVLILYVIIISLFVVVVVV